MNNNSITVIIPIFNAAATLARCLDSVFSQALVPDQVIVINDGSTDASREVAYKYKDCIEYIEQTNQGPASARNAGLKASRGDYVAFLDADDYWHSEFLSNCVEFLAMHINAVAVTVGQSIKRWGHPEVVRPILLQEPDCPSTPFVIDNFFSFWAKYDHVVTGASLFRRSTIEKAGYQRTNFRICEDLEYWGYLATYAPWGFIPKVLWICDPTPAAAEQGWIKKHEKRLTNLPEIKDWESRIKPRLKPEDVAGFEEVKARITTILVHQNILAGDMEKAKKIFLTLGDAQSQNSIIKLLHIGHTMGSFGWSLVCKLIQFREHIKAFGVLLTGRLRFQKIPSKRHNL